MDVSQKKAMDSISARRDALAELLESWVNVNSFSYNCEGLSRMAGLLSESFAPLGGTEERHSLSPTHHINRHGEFYERHLGEAIAFSKKGKGPISVFLAGHMDTVYTPDSPFQKAERIGSDKMQGPGATDMKGGLVILLTALEILESSPYAGQLSWEVLINPDEEIGSPGTAHLFAQAAKKHSLGLIFEPSFSDGALVSARKGSSNYTIVSKGKAAHAGRDFTSGRNAITALSRFFIKCEGLTDTTRGITVNIGHVDGGGAVNVVPDIAVGRINVRVVRGGDVDEVRSMMATFAAEGSVNGIELQIHDDASCPPKPFAGANETLFNALSETAATLGLTLTTRPSGGVCDGSRLYAAGLPNIDTLGAVGGNIHTPEEYILLDSLVERAQLTALFLMRLASGEITLNLKEMRHA